jgi:hypothetical protein
MPNRTGKLTAEETEYYEFKALAGLINNSGFSAANEIISESDFHKEEYGFIFLSVRELDNIGKPYNNIEVLTDYLIEAGRIKDKDGFGHLINQIITSPTSTDKLEKYCKKVKAGSLFRQRESAAKDGNYDLIVELTEELNDFDDNNKPEVLPLIPEPAVNTNKFPTHALGEYLSPAIKGIQEATMFSETLIAHSALSALISATQGIGMVMTNKIHGYMLLSTAFLLIGRSSEGKGRSDEFFFSAIRECEKERRAKYFEEDKEYKRKLRQWESEIKKVLKDEDGESFYPDEPVKPLDPRLVTYAPTIQDIIKAFIDGASSITLTAEDGKSFLGGWSLGSSERAEASMAILCKLLDSGRGEKEIASDINKVFSNRAFCMAIGLQPVFWQKLLAEKTMLSIGLMSRMLVCYPDSTIGYRPESDVLDNEKLDAVEGKIFNFNKRITELIGFMYSNCVKEEGELDRLKYKLSVGARKKWATFQREYQEKLRIRGGEYAEQQEMLGKMPLQPVKIATALFIFEQLDVNRGNFGEIKEIPVSYIERGIEITKFYWHETKWLFEKHEVSAELATIQKLGNWLRSNPETTKGEELATNNKFKLRDILMRRPAGISKRSELLFALDELEKHNQGRLIKSGRSFIFEIFHGSQADLL